MGHPRSRRLPIDPRRDPYFCEWGEVVGGRIRRLRQARGMTLRELADNVRTAERGHHSIGYLSKLERGWSSPPFFTYVAIIEALDGDIGRMLGPDPFVTQPDAAEEMLLTCLRDLAIPPHEAMLRILRELPSPP
jgi:transcriptional regulator with XRE-family HTH domain